jgi:2-succinyl-5-enolpyruvyl-6-hydroxy-3-cyclohexene-1-carboxylate synthase
MENKFYSAEKNVQILIALLKANNIRYIIASPGTTNISFVGSVQQDSFFTLFSAPDERSAAYIACGLAAESNEVVALSCTGATASRNYLPGLTEAYYRKLPVLAITSSQDTKIAGHLSAQFIDRSQHPSDTVKYSIQLPLIQSDEEEWSCIIKVNQALSELWRNGGGPVHINLMTRYSKDFSVKELPSVRCIKRYTSFDNYSEVKKEKIAIFIGSHHRFTSQQTKIIDSFCEANNAVVFCDHSSGYYGEYKVLYALSACQNILDSNLSPDLLIHIGEISGDYYTIGRLRGSKEVWRVNPDGEMRDLFHKLTATFEMSEEVFFNHFTEHPIGHSGNQYLSSCLQRLEQIRQKIDLEKLPFSNIWIASILSPQLPSYSSIHLGILNTLRSWNFFGLPQNVYSNVNVGGFGIDGGVSSLIGASLANPEKLFFGIIGDLAFFYDLNVLGNRHIGNNVRILLINNGIGTEFKNYNHPAYAFEETANLFMAAGGHYGQQSHELIKHYAQDLGFEYLSADSKEDFLNALNTFISPQKKAKSIIFEIFTKDSDESDALKIIHSIEEENSSEIKKLIKTGVKKVIGEDKFRTIITKIKK